jgi:hypothetical protein
VIHELFVAAVWALFLAKNARIAFSRQTSKLAPVMRKFRQGVLPAALVLAGFAPLTLAHSMPGPVYSGSGAEDTKIAIVVRRDGISLDEAVARAERQYRARVVRTDVHDEDGRKVYVLKLLREDGRVFTVRIDASTGGMR